MKEFMSRKKKADISEIVALTEECSALFQRKLQPKLKDPRRFTIPSTIGEEVILHALYDLGANINLMPLKLVKKLNLGDLKPKNMTLTLVGLSITHLYGVIKDVSINVERLVFPADFMIVDINEDADASLI
ncbi:uncharacterized protein LOC127094157 [Lathyrus oleraceus]|uniref:uncharacterized protein LOC127094157 n=1 Tax=Pisum sativum TaxID=3888 RepID=UPI0021CE1D1F|nr:uncharacterized protein LOC127094157 [Pisum sativum]